MAVARVPRITGSSPTGFQDAVDEGPSRVVTALIGITGLKVIEQKAKVESCNIVETRVTVGIVFGLE